VLDRLVDAHAVIRAPASTCQRLLDWLLACLSQRNPFILALRQTPMSTCHRAENPLSTAEHPLYSAEFILVILESACFSILQITSIKSAHDILAYRLRRRLK
jgi:hypothetical protein